MDALDEPLLVDDEDDDVEGYTLEEFEYGSLCCVAVMKPVVLTMVRRPQRFRVFFNFESPGLQILTCLAVSYIEDPQLPPGEIGNRFYLIYAEPPVPTPAPTPPPTPGMPGTPAPTPVPPPPPDDHTAEHIGQSLVNALVIVGFIVGVTFVMVFFMYMKCWRCIGGYFYLSGISVFAMLSYSMLTTAVRKFNLAVSSLVCVLAIYNYTCVGMLATFYQKGVPETVSQGYKVRRATLCEPGLQGEASDSL
jgi:hypothetical protein